MKKVISFVLLLFVVLACTFAEDITYVYDGRISSSSFEEMPEVGSVYCDSNSNILIVSNTNSGIVAFDKFITKGDYSIGNSLNQRSNINSLTLNASLDSCFIDYSFTCSWYPFCPVVSVGTTWTGTVMILAGAQVMVPLTNMWDSKNSLVQNGKLKAIATIGASVYPEFKFACLYGFSYSHNIDSFRWEVGANVLGVKGVEKPLSPYIGLGVDF